MSEKLSDYEQEDQAVKQGRATRIPNVFYGSPSLSQEKNYYNSLTELDQLNSKMESEDLSEHRRKIYKRNIQEITEALDNAHRLAVCFQRVRAHNEQIKDSEPERVIELPPWLDEYNLAREEALHNSELHKVQTAHKSLTEMKLAIKEKQVKSIDIILFTLKEESDLGYLPREERLFWEIADDFTSEESTYGDPQMREKLESIKNRIFERREQGGHFFSAPVEELEDFLEILELIMLPGRQRMHEEELSKVEAVKKKIGYYETEQA